MHAPGYDAWRLRQQAAHVLDMPADELAPDLDDLKAARDMLDAAIRKAIAAGEDIAA